MFIVSFLSLSSYLPPCMFTVLPLNTKNVASVFQIVPLNKKGDYGTSFWYWLEIPHELCSQPLKAAGWYVDEGERCSWQWIVLFLDHCNETNVSDYLLPYVESPAGVMSYIQCMYIYMYMYITCVHTCTCTCICAENVYLTVF